MRSTLVIIPTFEEIENLPETLGQVLLSTDPDVDVLVVDDDSPDGTGEIADRFAGNGPRVYVLHRAHRSGLGAAVIDGISWALQRQYQTIATMDAGGRHRAEDLPRLLAALHTCDVVSASRWGSADRTPGWLLNIAALGAVGNRLARWATGLGEYDLTSGFRVFRADALRAMPLAAVASPMYCFQIDVLRHAARVGLTVHEVPIANRERRHGRSKSDAHLIWGAAVALVHWRLEDRRVHRRSGPVPRT